MAYRSWITEEGPAGCSKRLSSKAAASEEARRTLRYVEPLSDARTPLAGFLSILLGDDVAYEIVQSRIRDLDFDEFPRSGGSIINVHDAVDLGSQPFMASLEQ